MRKTDKSRIMEWDILKKTGRIKEVIIYPDYVWKQNNVLWKSRK